MHAIRVVSLIGLCAICALPAWCEEERRTISVSGTAVTTVVPDLIVWNLATVDEDRDLMKAKENSDTKLQAIMALVKELGVADEDVQTGYVNITREYNRDDNGNPTEFKGYSIRRGVLLKQRDLTRFDEFLSRLLASSEMEANFSLDSSEMEAIRWDTRLKAVKLAMDKAQAMAEVLHARVGQPVSVREPEPAQPFSNRSYLANGVFMDTGGGGGVADSSTGTFAPGSIEVRVSVDVTFELM